MISRLQLTAMILAAILGGVLLFTAPLRAADPRPIACPSGQTTFLEGRATPNEALLVYLADRAVGGGLADSSGAYRLPLRVQERPGSYPVEVRLRSSRAVVERFTCFVDVPVGDSGETPTAEIVVTAASTQTAQTTTAQTAATARPSATRGTTTPQATGGTRTITATTNGTRTITPTRGTPTVTPTGPTATATTTGTTGPSPTVTTTAATSGTATVGANEVIISFVVLLDPVFPEDTDEYVEIENRTDRSITITGWQLRNASRSTANPYVFPSFVIEDNTTIAVYSNAGSNDLEFGDFYWGQTPPLWQIGDRAELRDAQGNLIDSYVVVEE